MFDDDCKENDLLCILLSLILDGKVNAFSCESETDSA